MEEVILVIHLILALSIIGLVLLQRSEGGGLGIGGSGGLGGLSTPHGTKNVLTKMTAICAAGFFCTSLVLGVLAGTHSRPVGILETLEQTPAPVIEQEQAPATDEQPAAEPEEEPSAPKAE